jgi:TolB-like protein/class 3 adenylate cyclase
MTTRRLTAILAADVVGFSKLVGEDEAGTLAALKEIRKGIVNPVLVQHGGRIFKLMGDGLLAEFPSAVQALEAAIGMQKRLHERNAEATTGKPIEVRIGIHQGDVVVEGTDLLGDGVNIAARLEALAEPGGICISGRVHEDAAGKIALEAKDLGDQSLKNIARPVRAYRVSAGHSSEPNAPGARPALPLPDKPSLAVLPFQNMSGDPEQEYFADGMVEEIITALSQFRQLFVIARNSSFAYKGKHIDIKQVGRELGVRYVLEGSVRKAGNRVRITGQLIDALSGAHLWADRFDGGLENVFDLQDQVTISVVGAIAPKLEQAEIERVKNKPTGNQGAYDVFLRGMASWHQWTQLANNRALALFYRAIEIDPDFPTPYGLAAACYIMRSANGWSIDRDKEKSEAVRMARKGADLGRDDALVLCWSGHALVHMDGDFDLGVALVDRALALNPNLAVAWQRSGWVRNFAGEPELAVEHLTRAIRLNPLDPLIFLAQTAMAFAHFLLGRDDEALAWASKAVQVRPGWLPAIWVLAASNGYTGRLNEARAAMARLREANPDLRISNIKGLIPVRRAQDVARWDGGFRLAGLPE